LAEYFGDSLDDEPLRGDRIRSRYFVEGGLTEGALGGIGLLSAR